MNCAPRRKSNARALPSGSAVRLALAALAALCACASAQVKPLPAAAPGALQPLPVQYEQTRFLFFRSQQTDGLLTRFLAAGPVVLATLSRPENGLFASSDEGGAWTYATMSDPPRQVLFDPADPRKITARAGMQVLHSDDGGHSWNTSRPAEGNVDALAVGAGGAIFAAVRSAVYQSADGGKTWRALPLQVQARPPWRVRSIAADPAHPQTLYVSIRAQEEPASPPTGGARGGAWVDEQPRELLPRFVALLDYSSDEAVSALALADARSEKPGAVAWNAAGGDGVYYTEDGGGLWKKSGLALDAYVALQGGAVYAVAADPILQAAALVRRYPDLAALASRQMHGDRADPAGLKAACRFPGRDKLLAGPVAAALVYRSADAGVTWARVVDPPLPLAVALRATVENAFWEPSLMAPPQRQQQPQQHLLREVPQRGQQYQGMANPQKSGVPQIFRGSGAAAETLLSYVDPLRLLAHFNGGAALSGISGEVAYAATETRWDALAEQLAAQSQEEGEISLGPGAPADTATAYELLQLAAGGWQPLTTQLPTASGAFPVSLAATPRDLFVLLSTRNAQGQRWRSAFRLSR